MIDVNHAEGRDTRTGRFSPGNKGGPGNPFACRVAALRRALLDAVSEDDLRAVVAAVVSKAKSGDLAAVALLLDRLLGKPAPAPDPDGATAHILRLREMELTAVTDGAKAFAFAEGTADPDTIPGLSPYDDPGYLLRFDGLKARYASQQMELFGVAGEIEPPHVAAAASSRPGPGMNAPSPNGADG